MKCNDRREQRQLVRMALRLQRHLEPRRARHDHRFREAVDLVLLESKNLERQLSLTRSARFHGWYAAAKLTQERTHDSLSRLQQVTAEAAAHVSLPQPVLQPTLRDIHAELLQLRQEFAEVTFTLTKAASVAVVTEPVTLKDIFLGSFKIVLELHRLDRRADISAFEIIAMEPNPATSSSDVTHPHVRDQALCAGEATIPIAAALAEGRICDAFLAINAVLNTYNPHSPYVPLENWSGTSCADCDTTVDEDDRYYCDGCGQEFCSDCIRCCDCCQESRCRQCLELDEVSDRLCCRRCQRHCGKCKRLVDADSFDPESSLCPGCLEERREAEEEQEQNVEPEQQHEQQETDHEHQHANDDGDSCRPAIGDAAAGEPATSQAVADAVAFVESAGAVAGEAARR